MEKEIENWGFTIKQLSSGWFILDDDNKLFAYADTKLDAMKKAISKFYWGY